jgi:hypothetical protein
MDEELDGVDEADSDARNDTTADEHVGIVAFSLQTSTEGRTYQQLASYLQ